MSILDKAKAEGRDYITPEDIQAAINEGMSKGAVQSEVLDMLGQRRCEDASLCAFLAHRYEKDEQD